LYLGKIKQHLRPANTLARLPVANSLLQTSDRRNRG
jgi:hypothetical protein